MQEESLDPIFLSVVIPMLDEAGNVAPLLRETITALEGYSPVGKAFEIICVDDGSRDATAAEIGATRREDSRVRLVRHARRLGMSAAIRNGVRRARADWILTLDGDGQNDPADASRLLDIAWREGRERKILVGGLRARRRDTLGKRLASRCANAVRRAMLRDKCSDTGCSLKVFPRQSYLDLPFFSGLHRFMPALMAHYGNEIVFVPVNDRPRRHGVTKSDFAGRAVMGLFDLLGVVWLIRRTPAAGRGRECY
ncbi:MAG: glycosyltransferase [Bdellovibrionales bacterium]